MTRRLGHVSLFVTVMLLAAVGPSQAADEPPPPPGGAVAPGPIVPTGDADELGSPPPPPPLSPDDAEAAPAPARRAEAPTRAPAASEREDLPGGDERPAGPPGCRYPCEERGACAEREGRCVAVTDADCRASVVCGVRGLCTALDGRCVATTEADCGRSADCASSDLCGLDVEKMICAERSPERYSRPLLGVGIASIVLGGMAFLAGAAVALANQRGPDEISGGLLIGGGIGLAAGIPMTVVGARRVEPSPLPDPFAGPGPVAGLTLSWEL